MIVITALDHYCLNTWWFLPFVISCLVVVSHPCPQTNPRRRDIGTNKLSDTTINRSLNGTVLALSRRHGQHKKRTSPRVSRKASDPFTYYRTLLWKKGANVDIDNWTVPPSWLSLWYDELPLLYLSQDRIGFLATVILAGFIHFSLQWELHLFKFQLIKGAQGEESYYSRILHTFE